MFENEFLTRLLHDGLDVDVARKVLHCFDAVAVNYTITKSVANITVYNADNVNRQFMDIFLQCKKFEGQAPGSLKNVKTTLQRFLETINCSVLEVSPMNVRIFLAACQNHNGKTIKNSTIEKYKQHISTFYRWLITERQIAYNPVDSIPVIKTVKEYKGALSVEEVKHIKFACNSLREQLLVEFLVSSGVRINEFVNIKFRDINLHERSVKVLGKGNKERMVYFSAEAKILIEEYFKISKSEWLYGGIRKNHNGVYGKLSTSMARIDLESICNRVADKIKLSKVTPHTFRRTFATTLLSKGVPLENVSKMLGHASLQTTMRYVQISDDDLHSQHLKFVS